MGVGPLTGGPAYPSAGTPTRPAPADEGGGAAKVVAVHSGPKAYGQDMRVVPEQEAVTGAKLVRAMPAILERLRLHREAVDRECEDLRRRTDSREQRRHCGLPLASYPIGFCRVIRDAVWDRALADPVFVALLSPGVLVRKVFVLLKGRYFQNAVQLGNLYVDVANDTVWVNKPKLEWAHVAEVDYRNAECWDYFGEVAQRYLNVVLYPNFLFPLGFPLAPFFAVRASGQIGLLFAQDIIFLKDLGEGMPRLGALLANEKWMSRRLPLAYEGLLSRTFGPGARADFPLKFAPISSRELRDGVIAECIELGQQPAERARTAIDHYIRTMVHAANRLTQLKLAPDPAELARLRDMEAVPRPL